MLPQQNCEIFCPQKIKIERHLYNANPEQTQHQEEKKSMLVKFAQDCHWSSDSVEEGAD